MKSEQHNTFTYNFSLAEELKYHADMITYHKKGIQESMQEAERHWNDWKMHVAELEGLQQKVEHVIL